MEQTSKIDINVLYNVRVMVLCVWKLGWGEGLWTRSDRMGEMALR